MSDHEWKPGDVAMLRHQDGSVRRSMFGADGEWHCFDMPSFAHTPHDSQLRPLVVIDPEDRAAVEKLRDLCDRAYLAQTGRPASDIVEERGVRGNVFQAALREFVDPTPQPTEPGLWAVVEASCVHSAERMTFVHGHRGWNSTDGASQPDPWEDLRNPVVIREGVPSDG